MKIKWLLVLLFCCQLAPAQSSAFRYLSPRPNSALNSRTSNIVIRQGSAIDRSSVDPALLEVSGSASGIHHGSVVLADDGKTIVFRPADPFAPNETVSVTLAQGMKTADGAAVGSAAFSFAVSPLVEAPPVSAKVTAGLPGQEADAVNDVAPVRTDSLPSDMPAITIGTSNDPSPGMLFLTNQASTVSKTISPYLMIADNAGMVSRYKKLAKAACLFKMEADGSLSYSPRAVGTWVLLDTSLTEIDTMLCNYGYTINIHDFLLLPNGHTLYIADDPQYIDMSLIVPGGRPNATVTGTVIQELDAEGNLVFQWRSWDDLPISSSYFSLTGLSVDLIHPNALAVDHDGNILASMRYLSAILKIDRETGRLDWVLGGKLNQFTFINEHESNAPTYFSNQHNIQVLPNGNITLFDNGTQHSPAYSRGVEYKLDIENKTAEMVWEYRHSPDIYTDAMGSMQRLANGNSILGWGSKSSDGVTPVLTEVHPDNSVALEVFLPKGQYCYRAYKYPWVSQNPEVTVTAHEVLQGNEYEFKSGSDSTGVAITFAQLNGLTYANAIVTKYAYAPVNPAFLGDAPAMAPYYFTIEGQEINSYTGQVRIDLHNFPGIGRPQQTIVYVRPQYSELFIPLATSFDSAANTLSFTTSHFGAYAFGIPQTGAALAPAPFTPKNGEIVNGEAPVKLVWGTRGLVQTYHLQAATDSAFTALIADIPEATATMSTLPHVPNNATVYWRVNTTNSAGTSAWSAVSSFRTASPFIAMTFPTGGERLYNDSTYIIRWQSNIYDAVRIQLMKGSTVALTLMDSLVAVGHGYIWKVPSTLAADTVYTMRVTTRNMLALPADSSKGVFSVGKTATSAAGPVGPVTTFALGQNYPNPFNPSTLIAYQLPASIHVTLKVFDIMGRHVRTLVDERKDAGRHAAAFDAAGLPSGVYFYRLQAGAFVQVKKLMLLR